VSEPLKRTPLYSEHKRLNARLVPFAGWEMPVQYEGVVKEHTAVRTAAGLFDVSHMGELRLRGPNALALVSSLVTNAVHKLAVGRAIYTCACNEKGTILDDLIIYRIAEEDVLVVCNAGNLEKMSAHFALHAKGKCDFEDQSAATSLLALQGPKAIEIARKVGAPESMLQSKSFSLSTAQLAGVGVLAARTGYTGEDGFELFVANEQAPALWRALIDAGAAPIGLGARDTLRLEARLSLYGNDIDETTNPLEAGLSWVVKLDHEFMGKKALEAIKAKGNDRQLVGIEMTGRGIARHGYPIVEDGKEIGIVTSGSPGPTVGKNIGLGYVPVAKAAIGTKLGIQIRDKVIDAVVAETPFYKRSR
jgi:aminomethyltransferase